MTLQGIILVCLSAMCHATWNLLAKSGADPVAFMRKALMWTTICYSPLFVVMSFYVPYSATYVACMLGSGAMIGMYFFALSTAYRLGDLSIVYPLARSFPILILTFTVVVWAHPLSLAGLAGVLLIVGGCFLLPLRRFGLGPGGLQAADYLHVASLWALLAALLTTGYSLVDKHAAVTIPADPSAIRLIAQVNYVYLQNVVAWVAIEAVSRILKQPRPRIRSRAPLIAGLVFLVSYSLIMMALATNPVTYVVSFRQISIILAAVVSMIWIEKRFSYVRLVAVVTIFAGLVLVAAA